MSSKTPKVGPYGETFLNPRTGKRDARLTAQGKEIAEQHFRDYPEPIRLMMLRFPGMTRLVIRREGEESAAALAAQGVVIGVIKWEPARGVMATAILQWTRSLFRHVLYGCETGKRGSRKAVSLDWQFSSENDGCTLNSVMIDERQVEPIVPIERDDLVSAIRKSMSAVNGRPGDVIRSIYFDGCSLSQAGSRLGGWPVEYTRRLRDTGLRFARAKMNVFSVKESDD